MKRLLTVLAAALCCMTMTTVLTSCSDSSDNPVPTTEPESLADYTVIFYGHGGSNLDSMIMANLQQFTKSKRENYERVNIVVQHKFSTSHQLFMRLFFNGDSCVIWGNKTVRMILDPGQPIESQLFCHANVYGADNADATCPDSLSNFIKWAAETRPAKNYLLILSDHGGGYRPDKDLPETPTRGLIYDSGNDDKHFTVSSLHRALANAGVHLQTVYLDACLMNTVEYQFELKDVTDYLVLSTYQVPDRGGRYDILIDQLAAHPTDIEAALSQYNRMTVSYWDDTYPLSDHRYYDMSVIRTSKLDAFGQKFRTFTDKLVDAYQRSADMKTAIDSCTATSFRVYQNNPSYDIVDYYTRIYEYAKGVIDDEFFNELEGAFLQTVVSRHASQYLELRGLTVDASIMIGTKGHYRDCLVLNYGTLDDPEFVLDSYVSYEPNGERYEYDTETGVTTKKKNWGGTLEGTYQQLAFDHATGWSRWIWLNEEEPYPLSLSDIHYKIPE